MSWGRNESYVVYRSFGPPAQRGIPRPPDDRPVPGRAVHDGGKRRAALDALSRRGEVLGAAGITAALLAANVESHRGQASIPGCRHCDQWARWSFFVIEAGVDAIAASDQPM